MGDWARGYGIIITFIRIHISFWLFDFRDWNIFNRMCINVVIKTWAALYAMKFSIDVQGTVMDGNEKDRKGTKWNYRLNFVRGR